MVKDQTKAGYKSLPFFQQSEIIYDFTVEFVNQYVDRKSRTRDQMIQAARSSKHPTERLLAPVVYVHASQGRV